VGFKDYMWEALNDPAAGINMIQTAENLAKKYGITREEVDAFASSSFAKAVAAQQAGFHAGEIVPVVSEPSSCPGYAPAASSCRARLTGRATPTRASHPVEVLAKLRSVYPGGVQTGGNSSALVDAPPPPWWPRALCPRRGQEAAGPCGGRSRGGRAARDHGHRPGPRHPLLLERAGLKLDDIGRFEINEAQGAQTLAVGRELGLDLDKLNVNGGAIALGHPLAATGVRLTITLARELRRAGLRYGVSSACIGGGQGIALLLENPDAA
jgi:acetyl-CoA C-acetyltransferase